MRFASSGVKTMTQSVRWG